MIRRTFLREIGLSAASLPFLSGLPSLQAAVGSSVRKQRMVIMISPNGTIP